MRVPMVSDVKASRRERYAALTCEAVLDAAKTLSVSDGFDATYARPVPIEATVEIFFSMFYNGVLYITDAADPDTASHEVETVIFCALEGLKTPSSN
jgi:hypothetical protein